MEAATLIRTVRTRQGLTQTQLAQRAGTTQPVVSAYEHGRRDPSVRTLRKLVEAGGERLDLGATGPQRERMTPKDPGARGQRLVDVLGLADAIPRRRTATVLRAPRMLSTR